MQKRDEKKAMIVLLSLSAMFLVAVCAFSVANTPDISPLFGDTLPMTTYTVSTTTTATGETATALLNLNTATKEELMALPGIGEVLAENILAFRSEHGQFYYVEDLLEVNGIGEKKLEAIRLLVTV